MLFFIHKMYAYLSAVVYRQLCAKTGRKSSQYLDEVLIEVHWQFPNTDTHSLWIDHRTNFAQTLNFDWQKCTIHTCHEVLQWNVFDHVNQIQWSIYSKCQIFGSYFVVLNCLSLVFQSWCFWFHFLMGYSNILAKMKARPVECSNFPLYLSANECIFENLFGIWILLSFQRRSLTMPYFKLVRSNFEILSGLCPCMFGATIANKIQASVALLVSKCVSIFDSVLALQI